MRAIGRYLPKQISLQLRCFCSHSISLTWLTQAIANSSCAEADIAVTENIAFQSRLQKSSDYRNISAEHVDILENADENALR